MKIIIILAFMVLVTYAPCINALDKYLVSCGLKSKTATSLDKRVWQSDDRATFSPPDTNSVSSAANVSGHGTIDAPFSHARIFGSSNSTYSFPVSHGPKFIRLYFSTSLTTTYNNISALQSFISLTANEFTLFTNFSAYFNSEFINSYFNGSFVEFYVPINGTILNLTFSSPKNNVGFVNAIEIVSVQDSLYLNNNGSQSYYAYYANSLSTGYTMEGMTSFQTAYRLIAGAGAGAHVQATNDVAGLDRTWYNDDEYIYGDFYGDTTYPASYINDSVIKFSKISPDAAPKIVYKSQRFMWANTSNIKMNLTWQFWVDPGFHYLLRLHLCENNEDVNQSGQRQFKVLINNLVADNMVDVLELSGGIGSPIYLDLIFYMNAAGEGGDGDGSGQINATTGKAQMLFSLLPYTNTKLKDVLLNGLEILKLNSTDKSRVPANHFNKKKGSKHRFNVIVRAGVGSFFMIFFIVCACLIFYRRRTYTIKRNDKEISPSTFLPTCLCQRFSLFQIRNATSEFDESLIIGRGGFGNVYKGVIHIDGEGNNNGRAITVAIKRLKSGSSQGFMEFCTEIEMLTRLCHLHLVSLIGYCNEDGEMILVYQYMSRGTLRDHLMYGDNPLSWKQRLMICLGSARGLHYLHSGAEKFIIHRDVKSTNILIDENWTAKVSDFGLCKVGPTSSSEGDVSYVSTHVKGTYGYLDPEYYKWQRLTYKSDVYSFGVVLLEVLSARSPVDINLPIEQANLAIWARNCYKNRTLHTIVDSNLMGQIAPECFCKFQKIAQMCIHNKGSKRPSMGDVVRALETTLQLQEVAEKNGSLRRLEEFVLDSTNVESSDISDDESEDHVFSSNISEVSGGTSMTLNR